MELNEMGPYLANRNADQKITRGIAGKGRHRVITTVKRAISTALALVMVSSLVYAPIQYSSVRSEIVEQKIEACGGTLEMDKNGLEYVLGYDGTKMSKEEFMRENGITVSVSEVIRKMLGERINHGGPNR